MSASATRVPDGRSANQSRNAPVDQRMDDRFEVGARGPIAEHDPARARPDRGCPSGRRRLAPKRADDLGQPGGTGRHHLSRQDIGVDGRGAERGEPRQAERLAGRDATGQRGPQHRSAGCRCSVAAVAPRWTRDAIAAFSPLRCTARAPPSAVFFSSIAIVSGPTPPGTGVSAPAVSHTAGGRHRPPASRAARSPRAAAEPAANSRRATASSVRREMPTSMTVAPGRTNSGVTKPGRPIADTRMSAVARDRRQVGRVRVADGDRRVALQQQHRHRLADNLAAADDHRARAGNRNAAAVEHLDHAGRRARREHGRVPARGGRR